MDENRETLANDLNHNAEGDRALPSPEQRPEAAVVIYDGQCGICRAQIERLRRWDSGEKLAYVSLHDPWVYQRWPDLPHDRLLREMAVVEADGNCHWGADAVRFLSRHLPRLWWLAPLLAIPGSMLLCRPLYRWVARNRYWLSGSKTCDGDACSVHR